MIQLFLIFFFFFWYRAVAAAILRCCPYMAVNRASGNAINFRFYS